LKRRESFSCFSRRALTCAAPRARQIAMAKRDIVLTKDMKKNESQKWVAI
jgi:hypothetical protein